MAQQAHRLETLPFGTNGRAPNSRYIDLIHRGAVSAGPGVDLADAIEATFRRHDRLNNWRELGGYDYLHFRLTTHEALGMACGRITLRLGGEGGAVVTLEAGDILVLPVGTSHTRLDRSPDSWMVGGYPEGRDWDLIRDERVTEEARAAIKLIGSLPIPARDPATHFPGVRSPARPRPTRGGSAQGAVVVSSSVCTAGSSGIRTEDRKREKASAATRVVRAEQGATQGAAAPDQVTATPTSQPRSIPTIIAPPLQRHPPTATTTQLKSGPAKSPRILCESSNRVPSCETTPAVRVASRPIINE
jgi:uncharacterized protein YjlB